AVGAPTRQLHQLVAGLDLNPGVVPEQSDAIVAPPRNLRYRLRPPVTSSSSCARGRPASPCAAATTRCGPPERMRVRAGSGRGRPPAGGGGRGREAPPRDAPPRRGRRRAAAPPPAPRRPARRGGGRGCRPGRGGRAGAAAPAGRPGGR